VLSSLNFRLDWRLPFPEVCGRNATLWGAVSISTPRNIKQGQRLRLNGRRVSFGLVARDPAGAAHTTNVCIVTCSHVRSVKHNKALTCLETNTQVREHVVSSRVLGWQLLRRCKSLTALCQESSHRKPVSYGSRVLNQACSNYNRYAKWQSRTNENLTLTRDPHLARTVFLWKLLVVQSKTFKFLNRPTLGRVQQVYSRILEIVCHMTLARFR